MIVRYNKCMDTGEHKAKSDKRRSHDYWGMRSFRISFIPRLTLVAVVYGWRGKKKVTREV